MEGQIVPCIKACRYSYGRMRISADDFRELNLMKYYRLIRKWACKTHSLKDADLELLVYKYFVDIPALMLRKIMANKQKQEESPMQQGEVNRLLRSFRDISIRLDRLEHVLIN